MGKTTDQNCVRRLKNRQQRIAFDLSNFILFGIKGTEKLKNIHQNSKITPDLKESYSFFLHLEKNA